MWRNVRLRLVGWTVIVEWNDRTNYTYKTYAGTCTAAIRKVIQHIKKEKAEIRLGQEPVMISIARTHKREIERWVEKGKTLVK